MAIGLAGLGGGCETVEDASFTYKLWDTGNIPYSQPETKPDLAVYKDAAKGDFLVEYNAISDRTFRVSRLAYFMAAGEARIARGKAPHFVKPAKYSGLQPLPNQVSTDDYVIVSTHGRSFTLFRPNQPPERHDLPFYHDGHWSVTRVALTPLAVTGDAVILGAFLGACGGVLALWELCQCNATIH
jgi:hypothetical protein